MQGALRPAFLYFQFARHGASLCWCLSAYCPPLVRRQTRLTGARLLKIMKQRSRITFSRLSTKYPLSVFDEPDLSASQRLTARGEITVPLLGTVQIGGLSIESAKSRLEALYVSNRFLRSPQVFLAIDEFSPKRITVLGQIGSPSSLELPMGANYLEIEAAIAMAGGFTDLARRSNIRVTRKDRPDGRERIMEVNMDDVLSDEKDGFATTRFRVYPGDIIYVPRRYF